MAVPRNARLSAEQWRLASAAFLDAVELTGTARDDYLAGLTGQSWLRAEVEALLAAHESAGDFIEQSSMPDAIGTRVGPWRIVSEMGRGGMGVVYAAQRDDQQFEKRVAVKIVSTEFWTPELLMRFRTERQILARLEHPNIAQLLDSGVSDTGLPYIVMEMVEGAPLTRHAEERALGIRERLALFATVCSAVHFAHQRLVVHRDIKPANILVTAASEVKLLDFGIAKFLPDAVAGETGVFSRRFTPDYASPEQLRGEPISTSSDVYSLGVLLYELLSGRRAFSLAGASFEEVVRRVCDEGPPPLRVPAAPGRDLEAIVSRATRKDPRERYGSAAELSDDIARYLEGRPVSAHRRSMGYVARKFVARHRLGVTAAGVAALALAGGVAGIVWQARVAERERVRAQQRFDDVRRLSGSLLFELHDSIASLPGAMDSRRLLVSRALEYLEMLSREAPGNPTLQIDLAEAYLRVGDLQGRQSVANLGDTEGALESYATAQRMAESVVAGDPRSVAARRLLAQIHVAASDVHLYLRQEPDALARAQESLRLYAELAAEAPADTEKRRDLALGYFVVARIPSSRPQEEVLQLWRRAGDIYEELSRAQPEDLNLKRNIALVHKSVGGLLNLNRDCRAAIEEYQKALDIDRARAEAQPDNVQTQLDLSFDLSDIGRCYENLGDTTAALEHYRQVPPIRQALLDAEPRDMRVRLRLAYSLLRLAWLELRDGHPSLADGLFQKAVEHCEVALSANASDSNALSYRAEARLGVGLSTARSTSRAAACPDLIQADVEFQALEKSSEVLRYDEETYAAQAAREAAACRATLR